MINSKLAANGKAGLPNIQQIIIEAISVALSQPVVL
jgi:hypothetical protein